jgi:hypothetical protein
MIPAREARRVADEARAAREARQGRVHITLSCIEYCIKRFAQQERCNIRYGCGTGIVDEAASKEIVAALEASGYRARVLSREAGDDFVIDVDWGLRYEP